jgi:hypothetical protein
LHSEVEKAIKEMRDKTLSATVGRYIMSLRTVGRYIIAVRTVVRYIIALRTVGKIYYKIWIQNPKGKDSTLKTQWQVGG